jgi:hypothetical protein
VSRPNPKRPLLPPEERARLRRMAEIATRRGETGHNRAYCKGVADVLRWIDGEEMSAMLQEVTR